jgi:hypothetical protein
VHLWRQTAAQPGTVVITEKRVINRNTDYVMCDAACSMRPGSFMAVLWELPASFFDPPASTNNSSSSGNSQGQAEGSSIVIGLVRYGATANSPCIVARPLFPDGKNANVKRKVNNKGEPVFTGRIYFHAPKAAGAFVYRMFDDSCKEKAMVTMGTSASFSVELVDQEVTSNLVHMADALEADLTNISRAIVQFPVIIRGFRNGGSPQAKSRELLCVCVQKVIQELTKGIAVLDEAAERKQVASKAKKQARSRAGTVMSEKDPGASPKDDDASAAESDAAAGGEEKRGRADSVLSATEDTPDEKAFWLSVRYHTRVQVRSHAFPGLAL